MHFSSSDVYTPGDSVDALIAMNPAALKMNLADLKPNGILIVNLNDFGETDLRKAQMTANPLEDHSLDGYRLFTVELTKLTRAALKELGLDNKTVDRCKNFFALGMCYWLYNRSMDGTHPLDRGQVQEQAGAGRSESAGDAGGLQLLRGHRSVSDQLRNSARQAEARRLSQHQRQHRAGDGLRRRVAEGRAFRFFSARIRSRRRRTFCTSFPPTRISA